jgi:hypothetical protein
MLLADVPPSPPADTPVPVEVRVTSERVRLDQPQPMGMVGLHLQRPIGEHAFGGISVFGASTGDRGGFFGWGITGGARWHSGPWRAEAGYFAGGGGGSPGWVGGGLMLRPHVALGYHWGGATLALGMAQVKFPNGAVRSTHTFASLDIGSLGLFGPADGRAAVDSGRWAPQAMPNETSMGIARYTPRRGSFRRDGLGDGPPLLVGGAAFRRDLGGDVAGLQPYWLLSAGGGVSAAYAGYAELLGGLGLRKDLPGLPLSLRAEAALGSGGAGAAADTGGGALRKLLAGGSWQVTPSLTLTALAGQTASRGPFLAREQRLELAWRGWDVLPGERRSGAHVTDSAPETLQWVPWTLSSGVVVHRRAARDDGSQPALSLTTLRLEREQGPHWRLTALAGIATTGRAGGYATGQLGVGWLTAQQPDSPWRVGAAASLGAAGGGGVRVGNGWIADAQLLARYTLSPHWALQGEAGWLRNGSGVLTTPQFGVSAVFAFSRLQGGR